MNYEIESVNNTNTNAFHLIPNIVRTPRKIEEIDLSGHQPHALTNRFIEKSLETKKHKDSFGRLLKLSILKKNFSNALSRSK